MIREQPPARRPHFEGSLSTAFGCTLEGPIPDAQLARLAAALMDAGCDEVGLSDTTGYADPAAVKRLIGLVRGVVGDHALRSEEHTSELQSLMRISYAVFCLKKKKKTKSDTTPTIRETTQ